MFSKLELLYIEAFSIYCNFFQNNFFLGAGENSKHKVKFSTQWKVLNTRGILSTRGSSKHKGRFLTKSKTLKKGRVLTKEEVINSRENSQHIGKYSK